MKLLITSKYFKVQRRLLRPSKSFSYWRTREGKNIMIANMTKTHLKDAILYLRRRYNEGSMDKAYFLEITQPLIEEYRYRQTNFE